MVIENRFQISSRHKFVKPKFVTSVSWLTIINDVFIKPTDQQFFWGTTKYFHVTFGKVWQKQWSLLLFIIYNKTFCIFFIHIFNQLKIIEMQWKYNN